MSHRGRRSQRKQPPQHREVQKEPVKKTLEDACKEIKKNLAAECQARLSAEKKAQDRQAEDEQMALIYGPNWKTNFPKWALDRERPSMTPPKYIDREPFADEDEGDEERVIPFPRESETRFKKRKAS